MPTEISALPTSGTPVDADVLMIEHPTAGTPTRKVTFAQLRAGLATLVSGLVPRVQLGSGTASAATFLRGDGVWANPVPSSPAEFGVAVGDETTVLTTGTAKVTFRLPHAMTLTAVRANLKTASSSGLVTVDINRTGTSVLGATKLSIDASERTSVTAATATSIAISALADDVEITVDIDTAGTGATGLKIWLIGTRP